ncbi:hypothetical protein [Streptomyces violaceusniger]|uniref:Uncharacterized protein n=1 Tax=Streptomyces violaceusniger (strain Tu 4113) TaxID=653045 RepID=G2PHQ3_STRV4|nr:hypothetical protein [Streptomyces violaceusniger]AEM88854.1 hypothetical protein Strvi_0078 [Streptomyces violaceusniger Tu 4113]
MTRERLTDLSSTNRPRPGSAISPGDVVRFSYVHALRGTVEAEGTVQPVDAPRTDWAMRPVFKVTDAEGLTRWPLQSGCFRVDPPPEPEDDSPARPFDDRKGY